jgi:hypothetical protein
MAENDGLDSKFDELTRRVQESLDAAKDPSVMKEKMADVEAMRQAELEVLRQNVWTATFGVALHFHPDLSWSAHYPLSSVFLCIVRRKKLSTRTQSSLVQTCMQNPGTTKIHSESLSCECNDVSTLKFLPLGI